MQSTLEIWVWMTLFISVICMKCSSFNSPHNSLPYTEFMFFSPVLSLVSWRKRVPSSRSIAATLIQRGVLTLGVAVLSLWLYFRVVHEVRPGWIVQSYLAVIPLYALGQFLSILLELTFLPTGWHYPAHFQYPFLSRTLAEFWGTRWASWVADWLNQRVFSRSRKNPSKGLLLSFCISELWHEILINLPLFLFLGVNVL